MVARYTTVAAVRNALAPTATEAPESQARTRSTAASLDGPIIEDQINEAAATVDSYLGGRYVTPVAEVAGQTPDPIGFWTRDIAAYLATLVHRRNAPLGQDEPVRLRYSAAMAALTAVRDRKAVLQLPQISDAGTAQSGFAVVVNKYDGALFEPGDTLTGTGADPWLRPAGNTYQPDGFNYG